MQLPKDVTYLLERMTSAGCQPWVVGGSLRDLMMGIVPKDWDIAVNAPVERIRCLFADLPVVDKGEAYGVLGIRLAESVYEVSAFRREWGYQDGRRPERVCFTPDLQEDLRRRDFTVNAMAYHPQRGLVDIFGGVDDLRRGLLRTVGSAQSRFRQDALRMLRGLRLASVLDFSLETQTAEALGQCRKMLRRLSGERVRQELQQMLLGKGAARVLQIYWQVLGEVMPEIVPMVGFAQHSRYHHLDVFAHSTAALESVELWRREDLSMEDKITVAWSLLLHDSGKPAVFSMDSQGAGHFYGHSKASMAVVQSLGKRLHFPRRLLEDVTVLVKAHDVPLLQGDKTWGRWFERLGQDRLAQLLVVQEGDAMAHAPAYVQPRLEQIRRCRQRLNRLMSEQETRAPWRLAIGGRDLMQLGMPSSPDIGRMLKHLTQEVLAERLPNDKDILRQKAKELLQNVEG